MRVIWLYGVPGVGKSTTGWQLYADLAGAGAQGAYLDIDQLGMCYPARADDPERHRLKIEGLAGVIPNYAAAGAEVLVVSGVLDPALTLRTVSSVPAEVTFIRLDVSSGELSRRLAHRGLGAAELAAVARADQALDAAGLSHPRIDTTGKPVAAVAADIRDLCMGTSGLRAVSVGQPAAAAEKRSLAARSAGRGFWVCGTSGVGKSTVAWAMFSALREAGASVAYVDSRQLAFGTGRDADLDHELSAANLAVLWDSFHAAGATDLVVAGPIDTAEQLARYRDSVPALDLTVSRLRADGPALRSRLHQRGAGDGPRLAGDPFVGQPALALDDAADESLREQSALDAHPVEDLLVGTTSRAPGEVAKRLLGEAALLSGQASKLAPGYEYVEGIEEGEDSS